jgi:hypothetical protein
MLARWHRRSPALLAVAISLSALGCQTDPPGNPMPPVDVITGAEFVYGPELEQATARRVKIPGDRVAELRGLFEGSRIDPDPARWAYWGKLKLFLKGGGTDAYDIYSTRSGPGAYADHLRRYFRGGSDAAFAEFLKQFDRSENRL